MKMKRAVVVVASNSLEHHVTLVYRTIFLGETLSLIERAHGWIAQGFDTLIDDLSLTNIIEMASSEPDCTFLCADVHHSPIARFLAETIHAVSPRTKIFIFGRATTFIPHYFARNPIDAVHESGDREAAIIEYLKYLDGGSLPAGVRLIDSGLHTRGRLATEEEWAFPSLDDLPIEGYRQYVRRFYGDHYSPRISATVGKGCSWGCTYCGATTEEGTQDRRRSPRRVVEWAASVPHLRDGFSLHMYHPNLFASPHWIAALCEAYQTNACSFAWRGVTTTVTLRDSHLVALAGGSGCTELAIGIETVNAERRTSAKSTIAHIKVAAENCHRAGIKLKGLVMVGYPGQTDADLDYTRRLLIDNGLSVRFTGYTPLQQLTQMSVAELDGLSLERFDRRTYFSPESLVSREKFFETLLKDGGYEFPDH
jgi:radical SAM superfamily enzyme YgiQ (UPF0313 family)